MIEKLPIVPLGIAACAIIAVVSLARGGSSVEIRNATNAEISVSINGSKISIPAHHTCDAKGANLTCAASLSHPRYDKEGE